MANTIKTKIRQPLKKDILDEIRNKFSELSVEEDGIYAITRGSSLHDYLLKLTKETNEEIIAEHSSSTDRYSTIYVEKYKNGESETVETKTADITYHDISES
jgi:hypothetical protein